MHIGLASAERSFSTLRRIKTWLRSRMGETRLKDLCLLYARKKSNLHNLIQSVIDCFANKQKPSFRIGFINIGF